MSVVVELFGIPRLRAKRASLTLPPGKVGDILAGIISACPALADLREHPGRYLLSLDGRRFLGDLDEWLPAGTRLLVLSADAGG